MAILFRPFGFITHKHLHYLAFQSFGFERTWLWLSKKRTVRSIFDIYVLLISRYRDILFQECCLCYSCLSNWAWNKGIKDITDTARYASYLNLQARNWQRGPFVTISIFPLWTIHLYVATLQRNLHVEYAYLHPSPEHVVPMVSLI